MWEVLYRMGMASCQNLLMTFILAKGIKDNPSQSLIELTRLHVFLPVVLHQLAPLHRNSRTALSFQG